MENLEKQLSQLPKAEMSKKTDWKIKLKIYRFLLLKKIKIFSRTFLHPHSLLAKLSLSALVIIVFLGSTAVYAVNNDHITPGHTFYPLKKTIENVEQQLSLTEKAKVETLNKLSERRLKEALNMAEHEDSEQSDDQKEESKNNIEQSIDEAVNNFDSAIETSKKIENVDNSKASKENLKNRQESMVKYLNSISDIAKDKKDESMIKKIDEARHSIEEHDFDEDRDDEERIKSAPKNNKTDKDKNFRNKQEDDRSNDRGDNQDEDQSRDGSGDREYSERD
ncbi:MAG: hypothetical protein QG642_18 [Patescibacteria group bacterium]|nr:hypothetical protein [Patescibacteria group bacterium]